MGLLHGLRQLPEVFCVDVSKCLYMYETKDQIFKSTWRGNGFTLYGLLNDEPGMELERLNWENNLSSFDLILIADIKQNWNKAFQISKRFPGKKVVIIDGEDYHPIFPFIAAFQNFRKNPSYYLRNLKNFIYFKREWNPNQNFGSLSNLIPNAFLEYFYGGDFIHPISFGFPEEKITPFFGIEKTKDFPVQIVDDEIAFKRPDTTYNPLNSNSHFFTKEEDYYADLQQSRFGITTKRAGWDCLRHYELAANGCVLCFKDFYNKPNTCAPHELSERNLIPYDNSQELFNKINTLTKDRYLNLQKESLEWLKKYTTKAVAARMLDIIFSN